MLTIDYPNIRTELAQFPPGLWPAQLPGEDESFLIAKVRKEYVLTARENRGFLFYFAPMQIRSIRLIGLVTAFQDDKDEPSCLRTLLFGDEVSSELLNIVTRPSFRVYFFDEHDRELASFESQTRDPAGIKERISSFRRSNLDASVISDAMHNLTLWFGSRKATDDARAFQVVLGEAIFPSDIFTLDLTRQDSYAGAKLVSHHSLVQPESGMFQEPDILRVLQRVFRDDQLFMNPMRLDKEGKEFSDALILTDDYLIIVQAKCSPNTPEMLSRGMARKEATSNKQLQEGQRHLVGAMKQCFGKKYLQVRTGTINHELAIYDRKIIGIIVLGELFRRNVSRQWNAIAAARVATGSDIVVVDYSDLSSMTFHLADETRFMECLMLLIRESKVGRSPEIGSVLIEHVLQNNAFT